MPRDLWINRRGVILIDVLLATSIFALLVTAVVGAVYFGAESSATSGVRARAAMLAEEGLEAARAIRDKAYANLTAGTHGLAITGNEWTFSGASDTVGEFTRSVTVTAVDQVTSSVTATVSWQQAPWRTGSISLTSYLTNWVLTFWALPSSLATLDLSGADNGVKVQVSGNYLYLVRDGGVDFVIVDVTTPSAPVVAGSLSLSGTPTNIAVSGNYAYVSSTDNSQEMQVIDVSTPSAPVQAGSYNASGSTNANGIFVAGTTVYLARASSANQELYLVDVTVATLPVLLGSYEMGADVNEVAVIGSYAYLATASNAAELQVVNVSVPTLPTTAGSLNLSASADALSVTGSGTTVVLGRADNYLYVINATTPSAPSTSGSLNATDHVNDVVLGNSNQYVFLVTSSGSAEFRVVDITTPTTPTTVSTLDLGGTMSGVAYSESAERAFLVGNPNSTELTVVEPL